MRFSADYTIVQPVFCSLFNERIKALMKGQFGFKFTAPLAIAFLFFFLPGNDMLEAE